MKEEYTNQFPVSGDTGKKAVFLAIRKKAPVARIDIAQETGLSPATVTSITAELIAKGLIEEIPAEAKQTTNKRGLPRVNLQVRAKAHLMAGMKLTDKFATAVIIDFVGNRIA
ncbi:MAG: winged helix-turn-helix transcriptional regulator, partial [Alphaproteobacteria bacterium]